MKKNAIIISTAHILEVFFTDLSVAAAITIPLSLQWIDLTVRSVCCILFLGLAIYCRYYYGYSNNKRVYK